MTRLEAQDARRDLQRAGFEIHGEDLLRVGSRESVTLEVSHPASGYRRRNVYRLDDVTRIVSAGGRYS